jgi:hypothetical protein
MKLSVKDLVNLIRVADFTGNAESLTARQKDNIIHIEFNPAELYPFIVQTIQGEEKLTQLFLKSEVRQVRDIYNSFIN